MPCVKLKAVVYVILGPPCITMYIYPRDECTGLLVDISHQLDLLLYLLVSPKKIKLLKHNTS